MWDLKKFDIFTLRLSCIEFEARRRIYICLWFIKKKNDHKKNTVDH